MKDIARRTADNLSSLGADYGDVRCETVKTESTGFRNARLEDCDVRETEGVGIRVLINGTWGFAACTGFESEDIDRAAARAVEIARAAGGRGKVELADLDIQQVYPSITIA